MDRAELWLLKALDAIVGQAHVGTAIKPIISRAKQKLARNSGESLAWEPVPLAAYGEKLPDTIRSSWVFILRAGTNTGAERHPNSHQRMMSYRGAGDLQTWTGERWHSNPLVSDPDAPMENRWISIPANTWHQAVVPEKDWVVVSFHTAPEDELVEERPDGNEAELTRQRKYV